MYCVLRCSQLQDKIETQTRGVTAFVAPLCGDLLMDFRYFLEILFQVRFWTFATLHS